MLNSQKKSLIRFLIIYLTSTTALFALASWLFYSFTKEQLLNQQKDILRYEGEFIKDRLRKLHQSNSNRLFYPNIKGIKSAIYDLDKKYIFGTLDSKIKLNNINDHTKIYVILNIKPYYLGAAYLMLVKDIDFAPIKNLKNKIFLFMLLAIAFFTILGYYLGRLFIAPMKESINRMNHFIQDATHELNTPISTILTNIEMIEALDLTLKDTKELKRIEIASKTLSRIYDDLAYLNLNHKYHRQIEPLNISLLIQERIEYFKVLAKAKKLKIKLDIKSDIILNIDKNDALRLFDNLISNAIKYNKVGGLFYIKLSKDNFIIQDSGVGIKEADLNSILERFKRANKSEGGFGIGLSIVKHVVDSYNFKLEIFSKPDQGTKVTIKW